MPNNLDSQDFDEILKNFLQRLNSYREPLCNGTILSVTFRSSRGECDSKTTSHEVEVTSERHDLPGREEWSDGCAGNEQKK